MEMQSASTFAPVGSPPAPRPVKLWLITLFAFRVIILYPPSVPAVALPLSKSIGSTQAEIFPSFLEAWPISLQTLPASPKAFISSELQVEIPKQGTSSFGIETPNATFADMTTFLMASKPSTSAVGSASA